MPEVRATRARAGTVAALTLLVLLGAAVLLAHRAFGAVAALALVAAASTTLLAVVTIVTWRRVRRAEERSRLTERALDAVPHAIFVVDARGTRNLHVNAAYSTLTGYALNEAVDGDFDPFTILAEPANVLAFDGLAADTAVTARVNVRRRDGATLPARLELRPAQLGDAGRYAVGILEPIETSGRAKDAFLSWLNHELRSPLNACVMWLDVLALAPPPDKLTKALEAIKRNLARQTRLVNDLNDAAKVAASGIEIRAESLDFVAMLGQHMDAWQLLASAKQLAFEHGIELEEARVYGDPERLAQALNHLLESSIHSTPSGGRVQLRVRRRDASVIVDIEDTGVPLSADDAENLAAPLWRAPGSAKARAGLGLGLAVAHHIAVRHGGSLRATSSTFGARFELTLPVTEGPNLDARTDGASPH